MAGVPKAMPARRALPGGEVGVQGDEGDRADLARKPPGLAPEGNEEDLIEQVLEGVHAGSNFRSPFLSASNCEAKARQLLFEAHTFRTRHTGPDPRAYLRRIDLSKLNPAQAIPFATHQEQKRLVGDRSSDARFGH